MTQPALIRADLHNHTHFSPDSILSPGRFVAQAVRRGLNCIAVTDHNTMGGVAAVHEAAATAGLQVIAGEEIRTAEGEVLGLFLTEAVPRGLSAEQTIDRIQQQGGLAGVPHPYDYLRSGLGQLREELEEYSPEAEPEPEPESEFAQDELPLE